MRSPGIFLLVAILLSAARAEPPPGGVEETDASTPAYRKALDLQRRGRWAAARKAFRRLLAQHPDSIHREDAENRSGENAYLGTTTLWESGPPSRRIDVAVMGDGFTISSRDQALELKWARLCVDVLWNEEAFSEYRNYFNFYFVRLASHEERVDPAYSEEEKRRIEERNRTRSRDRKTDYDTALDCKAAGPQGQVMADSYLVWHWLGIAAGDVPGCGDDRQVIAFARFGVLGMGGGGIANVGRPDKAVTVHEFGHSFVGLADEYTGNPEPPRTRVRAPNATTTSDPERVPWAHFLARRVKGVGVYEGGATYDKGVWRPSRSCAMNAGGSLALCPVCREAAVLAIYGYVSPIETREPDPAQVVRVAEGEDATLVVVPARPRRQDLAVSWFVESGVESGGGPPPGARKRRAPRFDDRRILGYQGGPRSEEDRSDLDAPPAGEESRLGSVDRGGRRAPDRHVFPAGKLPPGTHRVTAVVRDETPWVLKDRDHLLEERVTWRVVVTPRKESR